MPRSIRPVKVHAIGHEQDRGRALPNRLKPSRLGARMQQRDPVAVLGETGDPITDLVPIERRIEIDETLTRPWPI